MAATTQPLSATGTFIPTHAGWPKEEITENNVQKLMVSKFTEIVFDYDRRKNSGALKDLNIGPWYENDYALALQKHKQLKRLNYLVERNAFYGGFPPQGFKRVENSNSETAVKVANYIIKDDCLPTQGLENIQRGQISLIDCGMSVELAMYTTLREVLGDLRFNRIFSRKESLLSFHPHMMETPLYSLGLVREIGIKTLSLGDNVFFSNVPLYSLKHPIGDHPGLHAICITPSEIKEKKYIALGTSSDGKTESEMHDLLMSEFNKDPMRFSLVFNEKLAESSESTIKARQEAFTAKTGAIISSLTLNRRDFEILMETGQAGLRSSLRRLNIEAIQKISEIT